jgi:hypothetical protein
MCSPIKILIKFHFLPPSLLFLTPLAPFNINPQWLPHLVKLVPLYTPFKIVYYDPLCFLSLALVLAHDVPMSSLTYIMMTSLIDILVCQCE